MGHTKLRPFYSLVHPVGSGTGIDPYYTKTCLTPDVYSCLEWWRLCLIHGEGRMVRPSKAGTLIPMFGDGSGTGTGGILSLPNKPRLMWSATWNVRVSAFTSNYKELNTLKLSLIHLQDHGNLAEV